MNRNGTDLGEAGQHGTQRVASAGAVFQASGASSNEHWVPAGRTIDVAGYSIPGGMLYLGAGLASARGSDDIEPALIDPSLAINPHLPDREGKGMGYWPSYSNLAPECRAAYLEWLSNGRSTPDVQIGYVFLYYYGLERRLLVDHEMGHTTDGEWQSLVQEVERLLAIYHPNRSFRSYARGLLDYQRAARPTQAFDQYPADFDALGSEVTDSVALAVGSLIAESKPIPAEWALAWYLQHPDTRLRVPARRCPHEFRTLFQQRYRQKFGAGLSLKPNKRRLTISYKAASAGLQGSFKVSPGAHFSLPDIRQLSAPVKKLRKVAEGCMDELDAFSRWVGKNPDSRNNLPGLALLPKELVLGPQCVEVESMREYLGKTLGQSDCAVVETETLMACWSNHGQEKLAKKDAAGLASLLGKLGYGVEPDVRYGGPTIARDKTVVLFRLPAETDAPPSRAYHAATVVLHLAAAVAAVGEAGVTEAEERALEAHLDSTLGLETGERARLGAHVQWLLAEQPGLRGLRKRLGRLEAGHRIHIAEFAVAVATSDGRIETDEVRVLQRIYRLLDLDPKSVFSDLHRHGLDAPPVGPAAKAPVAVQTARANVRGFRVPPPAEAPARAESTIATSMPQAATSSKTSPSSPPTVALDEARLQTKLKETAAVSSLLASIFADPDPAPERMPPPGEETTLSDEQASNESELLDASHFELLKELSARPSWPRADLERLAARRDMMVDGALEVLNEAAFELVGDPLFQGEDPIDVDADVAGEMLE